MELRAIGEDEGLLPCVLKLEYKRWLPFSRRCGC